MLAGQGASPAWSRCRPGASVDSQRQRSSQTLGGLDQTGVRGGPIGLPQVWRPDEDHQLYRATPERGDREDSAALWAVGGKSGPRAAGAPRDGGSLKQLQGVQKPGAGMGFRQIVADSLRLPFYLGGPKIPVPITLSWGLAGKDSRLGWPGRPPKARILIADWHTGFEELLSCVNAYGPIWSGPLVKKQNPIRKI